MTQDDDHAALAHQQEQEQQQMNRLCAAFVRAQAEIEKAVKDKNNPHFRSKYADLGAVVDAIKPALEKHGLGFLQKFHGDDNGITVETIIIHESGETMSNGILSVPATKKDAQGFGSACTYARRYSLQAAFGVAPEDDDGNAASKASKPEQRKEVAIKEESRRDITDDRLDAAIKAITSGTYTTMQLHEKFNLTPEQHTRLEQALTQETI